MLHLVLMSLFPNSLIIDSIHQVCWSVAVKCFYGFSIKLQIKSHGVGVGLSLYLTGQRMLVENCKQELRGSLKIDLNVHEGLQVLHLHHRVSPSFLKRSEKQNLSLKRPRDFGFIIIVLFSWLISLVLYFQQSVIGIVWAGRFIA